MDDKLLQIINNYGVRNQQKKLAEEVFELQEAITKYESDDYIYTSDMAQEYLKNIIEEMADVIVMLRQFQNYYEITNEEISDVMKFKIDRQIERIKKENSNE